MIHKHNLFQTVYTVSKLPLYPVVTKCVFVCLFIPGSNCVYLK